MKKYLCVMEPSQTDSQRIFQGVKECAAATNTPLELLLLAKQHPECPRHIKGFHASGRVYWDAGLAEWITAHKEELESIKGETREHWLTRRDRANALVAELDLEERYKRIIDKGQVKELLQRISSAQVSLFNSRLRQELPARLNLPPEKIGEIDKIISELFTVMQKGLDTWK